MDNENIKKLRVVASYTTLPDRYDMVRKSIKSLQSQDYILDAIYLTIPSKAKRLNQEYPPIPDDISKMSTIIRIDEDYGPVTKIYGALISEKHPDTIIISCDDDVIYPSNLVSKLVEYSMEKPDVSICGTGALIGKGIAFISIVSSLAPFRKWNKLIGPNIPKEGREIDLIFGVAGVLYRRGFFPKNDNLYNEFLCHTENEYVFLNDDVLISGFLNKKGIKRLVYNDIPDIICQNANREDALSYNLLSMINKLDKSIEYMTNNGFFGTMEPLTIDETPLGKLIFVLIVTGVIILIFVHYYLTL